MNFMVHNWDIGWVLHDELLETKGRSPVLAQGPLQSVSASITQMPCSDTRNAYKTIVQTN